MSLDLFFKIAFFSIFFSFIISVILIRVPEEEKLLLEQFGDEYRTYIDHTGRLFPKLRSIPEALANQEA